MLFSTPLKKWFDLSTYRDKKRIREKSLEVLSNPKFLTYILVFILILWVCLTVKDYGITWDELSLQSYGSSVYEWYRTLGKDLSFMHQPVVQMYYYGPFYENILIIFEHIFRHVNEWFLRNIITGFVGVLGIYITALCGFELESPWMGLIAAISLALFPRYLGDITTNTKDIPFLVAYTFVLFAVLKLIGKWRTNYIKYSLLVGIALGMAISIRDVAVIWTGILILFAFLYWSAIIHTRPPRKFLFEELKKQAISFLIIAGVAFVLMALLWPIVLYNPIKNFSDALTFMAKFPFSRVELFNGQYFPIDKLPWNYSPHWILITTPLISIILVTIGLVTLWYKASADFVKQAKIGIVFLAFIVPILAIIIERSDLYNGVRQFLFVVPAMLLIGGYGLVNLFNLLRKQRLKLAQYLLVGVFILGYAYTIKEIYAYYPLEFIYFNSVAGGIKGAEGKYSLDYTGMCFKTAADWIDANYRKYTTREYPSFDSVLPIQTGAYLDWNFKYNSFFPDFYTYNLYDIAPNRYPTYKVVHTIKADGVPICIISVDPKVINHTKRY